MKKLIYLVLLVLILPQVMKAQQVQQKKPYDITKDRLLYTVGYAHLDTEWNWD